MLFYGKENIGTKTSKQWDNLWKRLYLKIMVIGQMIKYLCTKEDMI